MQAFFETVSQAGFAAVYSDILRYILPLAALLILWRCGRSLLAFRREPEVWAWLASPSGDRIPVTHWESLVGRAKSCDVVLDYPTISRRHAVLTRYDDGSWSVSDIGSKGGIRVNGADTAMCAVGFGDVISLGGVNFTLVPITKEQERIQASVRTRAGKEVSPALTLMLLSLFQVLACLQLMLHVEQLGLVAGAFGMLLAAQWALFLLMRLARRSGFDVETLAFFLTTMGVCVVSSSSPSALKKEMLAIFAGIAVFLILGWFLRDLERAKKLRYVAAAAGIALLVFNVLFGIEKYGAKNWVEIGPVSFQPSELVKLCFVFAGASTLQRLMTRRNLLLYIVYSAAICGCLALINDFGTAIIFFVTFLVTAFMRSGDFATIGLACAGTGFAGVLVLRFKPYALRRFSTWRHVWENALTSGYSQTRAMMCIASGGLFGLGGGRGCGHRPCVRVRLGGMGAAARAYDDRRHRAAGCVRGALSARGAKQLLFHQRRVRRDHHGRAGDAERVRHRRSAAADRRDLPVRFQRRLEYALRLGAACLYQGSRYAPERQLLCPAAVPEGG